MRASTPLALAQLTRVGMLPLAWSNVVTGALLAGGGPSALLSQPGRAAAALAASAGLYLGGMVLNDCVDAGRDRLLHPTRPLPSGRVGPRTAWALGVGLTAGGLAAAGALGTAFFAVALLIAGLAGLYNAGLKARPAAGALALGGCRAGNLALGITLIDPTWPVRLADGFGGRFYGGHQAGALRDWAPVALGVYIALVTHVSTFEGDIARRPSRLLALMKAIILFPAALAVLAFIAMFPRFSSGDLPGDLPGAALAAAVLLGVLIARCGWQISRGTRSVAETVRALLAGMLLVEAALLALSPAGAWCWLPLCCWPPAWLAMRWTRIRS